MKTLRIAGLLMLVSLLSVALMASTALAAGEISASRSFDTTEISAGDTVRVTVDITVGGDTVLGSVSLAETIPDGWSVTSVNDGGWTPSESIDGQWLGPSSDTFSSGYTTTIVYDLTSSATSTSISVSGLIEGTTNEIPPVDISSTVSGQTDITVTGGLAPGIHLYDGDSFVAAFANATAGDIIYLHAGTYDCGTGITLLTKSLSIIGDSPDTVTLDGKFFGRGHDIYLENINSEGLWPGTFANATLINSIFYGNVPTPAGYIIVENCNMFNMLGMSECYGIVRNNNLEAGIDIVNVPSGKTMLVESNYINITGFSRGHAGEGTLTFQNNIVDSSSGLGSFAIGGNTEVTGNTFIGGNPAATVDSADTAADILIYNNTFDSCTNAIRFTGDSVATIYLNEFIDVDTVATWQSSVGSTTPSTWQSSAMDYTINGVTLNGPLGNYYSDYTGADGNGDGIGDTAVDFGDLGADSYPLMARMEEGGITTVQTLAEMT
uniref:NosD domain-containing protein n=1 Tax=Methanolobus psychrotolerans TaxID=1874706 RepID=UPI001A918C60